MDFVGGGGDEEGVVDVDVDAEGEGWVRTGGGGVGGGGGLVNRKEGRGNEEEEEEEEEEEIPDMDASDDEAAIIRPSHTASANRYVSIPSPIPSTPPSLSP